MKDFPESAGHHHHHHHHHHGEFHLEQGGRFVAAAAVNLVFVGVEFWLGFRHGSSGLLADAGHNLGDVSGLLVSLIAFLLLKRQADGRFTYGFRKGTVLAAFLNSVLLLGAVAGIAWECVEHLRHGSPAPGGVVMATAAAGMVVNGLTAMLLSHGQERDLNVRGAYLHMLADALVSLGVVVSGALMMLTGAAWIDPVVGLGIAAVILVSTWGLFRESMTLLMDGTPQGIRPEGLKSELEEVENVADVHHLHVWAMSTTENALTAHVRLLEVARQEETRAKLKALLAQRGIGHATLEFEDRETVCGDRPQCCA